MSRPLHRGVSGTRVPDSINDLSWDSQSKDKTEKDDFEKRGSSDHTPLGLRSPLRLVFSDKENGFASDPFIVGTPRSRFKLLLFSLKFSLVFIAVVALVGSFWWTLNLSSSSRGRVYHGYRRLQEKLVSDLVDIGEISRGASRWKELETCSSELENFVPCFNVSDGNEFERKCEYEQRLNCLVLPPVNYKVPLRWPTGKDVIWVANVKITAQEVLSSGSLTKRMMMLDEEQISFRSASHMFDGVEDYSHQIAEMIGLRNESSFRQAGIRTILDIGCGYGSFGAHLFDSQLLTLCDFIFEAIRLQGVVEPPRVLKPKHLSDEQSRSWRPMIGMTHSNQRGRLATSGHRALSHYVPRNASNIPRNSSNYGSVPPPQNYRNNGRQNDYSNSRHPSGNWHANQNQFPQNDQNTNRANYGRQQNSSYRSDNNEYPNYGTQHTSDQQSMRRNDRPGYYTAGYQANNPQPRQYFGGNVGPIRGSQNNRYQPYNHTTQRGGPRPHGYNYRGNY